MTRIERADRRIATKELELARIQFEESTPLQIEANLARGALHQTLTTAAVMARTIRDALGLPVGEHLEEPSRDLPPKA